MDRAVRIIFIEASPSDLEQIQGELHKINLRFSTSRVDTPETFSKALKDSTPDLILSEYKLPSFDALSALTVVQKQCPGVPFILVSKAAGEGPVIETLKKGAIDYVHKQQISRLGPVVERALREAEEQKAVKRLELLKDELLDVLSHELKTPITVIQQGIGLFTDGTLGKVTPDQKEFLDTMAENTTRLSKMFDKVVLAGKVMTKRLNYEFRPLDGVAMTQALEAAFKVSAKSKGIKLEIEKGDFSSPCAGDSKLLTASFGELMENALQATQKDQKVNLSLSTSVDGLEMTVADTGSGIPPEELPTLFERFRWSGGINERKTGGLGLGLFIAKAIVEGHGGSLSVKSKPGQGTRVVVRIPPTAEGHS